MHRRNFIKSVSAAVIATSTAISRDTKPLSENFSKDLVKPPRLRMGDTLALITPGSYISEQEKKISIENLSSLGFKVVHSNRLMQMNGYFSATDKERAADVNEMFSREDVNGIVCVRGGYGCTRILPFLDYELIRKNPKPFIGFSDVTAIHYAIYKNSRLITFHGPVGISTFNKFSTEYFKKVLMSSDNKIKLKNSDSGNNIYGITTISEGEAKGELVGGNLSIAASIIGTPYDIDFSGKIIFLEEFLEEPYRIDRMLTQMIQAGKFEKASGVALGVFKMCESNPDNPSFNNSFTLIEVLKDRLEHLKIPVIYGLSFGHVIDKFTLPFGVKAELNTFNQSITLSESAVV
jgi:muramoyltetrapeptide carboxypeptidase